MGRARSGQVVHLKFILRHAVVRGDYSGPNTPVQVRYKKYFLGSRIALYRGLGQVSPV